MRKNKLEQYFMLWYRLTDSTYQFVFLHVDPLQFGTTFRQCYQTLITDIVALSKMYILQLWAVFTQLERRKNNSMIVIGKKKCKTRSPNIQVTQWFLDNSIVIQNNVLN